MKGIKIKILQKGLAILVATLLCVIAFSQNKKDAKILFHRGLHLEEVKGELKEAIAVYKQVVEQFPDERTITAKSHLHIGICYEKLGKKEAQKAYQLIIQEFADQKEVVSEARARLAALEKPPASAAGRGMSVRKVWDYPERISLTVSSNGRYLIYRQFSNVYIHDLATGKSRRLTSEGRMKDYTIVELSPDNKQIAYIVNFVGFDELRIIGLHASEPRVLYRTKNEERLYAIGGWSPDGKFISAVLEKANRISRQIVMISVADGSMRVLKTLDRPVPRLGDFSPDGRYIVYDSPPQVDSRQADIFLLAADGSHEVPLTEHPSNECVIDWTPDGDFLFMSDRTGTYSIWIIRVKDGRPQGAPELIKPGMGAFWAVGFTKEGSFYYAADKKTIDVHIATLDPQTGKPISPPELVSKRFTGINLSPVWSPDGKYLAYRSYQSFQSSLGGFLAIVIRSLDTGEERILLPKYNFVLPSSVSLLNWFPDGRSILASGKDWNRQGFFKIDIKTGNVTPIFWYKPGEVIRRPVLSPDGKTIFYLQGALAKDAPIMALDIETGQKKEIYRPVDPSNFEIRTFAISPDGQKLVFYRRERLPSKEYLCLLKVIPTEGGEPLELMQLRSTRGSTPPYIHAPAGLVWTPDGAHLIFWRWKSWEPGDLFVELWRASVEGGKPEKLGVEMEIVSGLQIHPDGRQIAFSQRRMMFETWVIENFLPKKKQAEK